MPSTGATLPPWIYLRAVPGLLAACLAAVIDSFYVAIIRSQRPAGSDLGTDWPRALFLAGVLAIAALALGVGSMTRRKQVQVTFLGMGVVVCWSWAVLGLFSIGLLLLAPAVLGSVALLLAVAAAPRRQFLTTAVVTGLLTLGILGTGLSLTWPASGLTHVVCPAQGHLQGSITMDGSLTRYRCDDGRLTRLP